MKSVMIILAAIVAGFFAGLVLSEVIGIAGVLLFQRAVGVKYLPIYLAVFGGGAALLAVLARRAAGR